MLRLKLEIKKLSVSKSISSLKRWLVEISEKFHLVLKYKCVEYDKLGSL